MNTSEKFQLTAEPWSKGAINIKSPYCKPPMAKELVRSVTYLFSTLKLGFYLRCLTSEAKV